jgi:Carboxypeptidase regulatory-like domain
MTRRQKVCPFLPFVLCLLILVSSALCQTESATLSGLITDPQGKVVPGVAVDVTNVDTNVTGHQTSNSAGVYVVVGLRPGRYRVSVTKEGFRRIDFVDLVLNVQDVLSRNFQLQLGPVLSSITVVADAANVNTTDATVSTVIDRKFVENMPLNGRSAQDLLTLAPGVVIVGNLTSGGTTGVGYGGEISVNGQRTEANYFTVDGVSANTGTAPTSTIVGAGFSGGVPGETALGTTQSIVSIDALQEFRASTSTYSAESGRTPGGQFSFSTRSGTNIWHGSAYDYFRNDVLDANNWFNNAANPPAPRLPERQNDFGGTLGGPIVIPGLYSGKDRTFFFFSYEGLRLRVPQPSSKSSVPDMTLRQQAPVALQPFLNAFPVPNGGGDGLNDGLAYFNLAYSAPSSLDNVGIRVDHSFSDKLKIFGRYASTPSNTWFFSGPAFKSNQEINVRTLTVGATSFITGTQANELRFNITQNNLNNSTTSTNFGGATPLDLSSLPGPNGQSLTPLGSELQFFLGFGGFPLYDVFGNTNAQRQYNVTDTYTWSRAAHQFKFGADWRRVTTYVRPITSAQFAFFAGEPSVLANSADFAQTFSNTNVPVEPVYHNFSAFIQDEWKAAPRLSLSLGLRWDVNPAPGNLVGPGPYTVDQITNLVTTRLAPMNTPLWNTDWHGFAPRVGLAYQLHRTASHDTVLRTGFGIFYDMGNTLGSAGFNGVGFSSSANFFGVPLPLTSEQVTLTPPSVAPPYSPSVSAFDPNLRLPYTMQWNVAVEEGLGANQTLTVNYVGSGGRKLLAQFQYLPGSLGNPDFSSGSLFVTSNRAFSNYSALQVKYQRNLSHGLQALASYTWSHSIDDASSNFNLNNVLLRSSSDFDVRHNFQTAITYDVPGSYSNPFLSAVLKHWGLDTRISARSALPVDLIGAQFPSPNPVTQQLQTFHPNLVLGQPIYVNSLQTCPATAGFAPLPVPGGRLINICAFTPAPAGVEGNTPRNFARGFDAVQADLALRRDFAIHEGLRLQFRVEAFNLLNHAIFGSVDRYLSDGPSQFGYAYHTLNGSLGGLSSLYQVGGPRSMQVSLKVTF